MKSGYLKAKMMGYNPCSRTNSIVQTAAYCAMFERLIYKGMGETKARLHAHCYVHGRRT